MVEIQNIKKRLGETDVLNGVSLKVNDGEVVAILGPSGSGKTTLLRTINFLNPADSGKITVDDVSLSIGKDNSSNKKIHQKDILKLRRKTGMVFQNYSLFKNKTALQNITEALTTVKKISKKEAHKSALELLEKVGLQDKADYYPSELSGGQQQRVGICRALAIKPSVILFDEPTSALDPELVGEVLETMKRVAKTGITMIVVTHEISFAREVANKVVYMEGGVIVEQGTPQEVIDKPKDERTIRFLRNIYHIEDYVI